MLQEDHPKLSQSYLHSIVLVEGPSMLQEDRNLLVLILHLVGFDLNLLRIVEEDLLLLLEVEVMMVAVHSPRLA